MVPPLIKTFEKLNRNADPIPEASMPTSLLCRVKLLIEYVAFSAVRNNPTPVEFSTPPPFIYTPPGAVIVLISIPLRYMHTTVEMVHKEDVENVQISAGAILTLVAKWKAAGVQGKKAIVQRQ